MKAEKGTVQSAHRLILPKSRLLPDMENAVQGRNSLRLPRHNALSEANYSARIRK